MEEQKPKKSRKHIGAVAIGVLVLLALVADAIGLIPLAEDFVIWIYWSGVAIYLWYKGFGFVNGRRLAVMVADVVVGMIPGLQALPQITVGIIIVIMFARAEEKLGISVLSGAISGKGTLPLNFRGSRTPAAPKLPLNESGKRQPNGGLVSNRMQMTDIKPPQNSDSKIVNLPSSESEDLAMAA